MRAGLRAEPAVVAPNVAEAEEAVGHEFNDAEDLAPASRGLIEMGAERGDHHDRPRLRRDRRRAARAARRYEATIEPLEPVASVGSGDAFLAGYVAARYAGARPRDCLAYGVACGAESTQHFGAGTLDPARGRAAARRVEVARARRPAGVA